ncbi:MAG: hypothetical protein E4H20_07785 [Spirochaetales bacterium]|nr:MAG: hypothetical protein E4H20_07785 [Spirochaetales bacterium]
MGFKNYLSFAGIRLLVVAMIAMFAISSCVSAPDEDDDEETGVRVKGALVAIFDFEVKSSAPGYDALATDVPQALAEAFIRGGKVRPLERSALQKIFSEQELALSGMVDQVTAIRIGKLAGARYALLGSVSVVGDQLRLSCRVIDVETAEIVYAGGAYGYVDEIFEIEEDLAWQLEEDFS